MIDRRSILMGAACAASMPRSATASAQHEVSINRFEFVPPHLEVRVGDTIRWVNRDLAPHTATATEFGWDTGELEREDAAEIVVTADMETAYFCVFHPHMKGTISIMK